MAPGAFGESPCQRHGGGSYSREQARLSRRRPAFGYLRCESVCCGGVTPREVAARCPTDN